MINNTIQLAQNKLMQHRELGVNSGMNIFEVARLLDKIKLAERMKENPQSNLFFQIGLN